MQSNKYVIDGDEDGVMESNFFSQLKNMLLECKDDNNDKNENQDNFCLLTKEPLKDIHIVLECGHKFNYIPIYREVIAQKTIGLSSTSYYNSHSLKKNEIKCPYCRNIQGKLLPYLEYDGVKKIHTVNYPVKMCMTSEPCASVNLHSKKSKKNTSCKELAIHCHNGTYLCKKHYELSLVTFVIPEDTTLSTTFAPSVSICGVILRYGKNKGTPCPNSASCRIHKVKSAT